MRKDLYKDGAKRKDLCDSIALCVGSENNLTANLFKLLHFM